MSQIIRYNKKDIRISKKTDWPTTTEDVAKGVGISWQTAQINLFKLVAEGKVKFRKVGKQNQWWLIKKYKKEF